MQLSQEISAQDGILCATVSGQFAPDEALRLFDEIVAVVAETGLTRVIVDYRKMQGQVSHNQRFDYATAISEHIAHAVAGHRIVAIQLAYVGQGESEEERRFGENVARQRGVNLISAATLEEAREWLEKPPVRSLASFSHFDHLAED